MIRKIKNNNKGFTLIELLAALVILTAIMSIAIPSISSSLERTKVKQDDTKKKILESSAELYVTDHKNAIYRNLNDNNQSSCYITLDLLDTLEENKKDSDGNDLDGVIVFDKSTGKYEYRDVADATNINECNINEKQVTTKYIEVTNSSSSQIPIVYLDEELEENCYGVIYCESYTFNNNTGNFELRNCNSKDYYDNDNPTDNDIKDYEGKYVCEFGKSSSDSSSTSICKGNLYKVGSAINRWNGSYIYATASEVHTSKLS